MKVYPDANIIVALVLGEEEEDLAELFLKKSADCLYSIVVSKTTFGEVSQRLENKGTLLLQKFIDDFTQAKKLEVIQKSKDDEEKAIELNEQTSGKFGVNDFIHALLAKKHADVFVTNDRLFTKKASGMVKTLSLGEFLMRLKPKA